MKKFLVITGIILITASQAQAGIFSKMRNWANTGWDNYNYGSGCPCHNHPHYHGNRFFNNGAVTGFTPPINGNVYPNFGNYHNPIHGRFDHLPNGVNTLNAPPQQMITDFNSNVGTRTGITILD